MLPKWLVDLIVKRQECEYWKAMYMVERVKVELLEEAFVEEEFEGGIIKADDTKRVEEQTTVVLFVVKMGELCYKDKDRFPTGPWCSEGDFVLTRPYSGTRVVIHGREFRIINDDTVEAVVQDPRGIRRA